MTNDVLDSKNRDKQIITRPASFNDFIGQEKTIANLKIFINSAKRRARAIDHILFYGPPGLGKTTLAKIIANERGVKFQSTSAPIITKTGDLASILTNIEEGDVLFIDEIHRLNPSVEETLYSALEDFKLDIIIGEGPGARSIKLDLPHFTMIAATTRTGLITSPLRDRFGIPVRLHFYTHDELKQIVLKNAKTLGISLTDDAAYEIAKRSRGTPRICIRLLKRIYDFAVVASMNTISQSFADKCLLSLDVDAQGLDGFDKRYLSCIVHNYKCGPVGIETLAAALSEEKDTLEDVIEPYLLQQGFVNRTPRGRVATDKTRGIFGLNNTCGDERAYGPYSDDNE